MSDAYRDWQDETVKVVMNDERVCSIWPADRKNASGWRDVGRVGTKQECLEFIKDHCDDDCRLRPEIQVDVEAASAPGSSSRRDSACEQESPETREPSPPPDEGEKTRP